MKYKKLTLILLACSIVIFGTIGYHHIESWDFFDSLYMTIITITTLGFQEIHTLSDTGRIFTMFLVVIGLGVITMSAANIAGFIVENELTNVLERKKMLNKIKKLTNHYIICGFGRIGSSICSSLREQDIPFLVIELKEEAIERIKELKYDVIKGNATQDSILMNAGIERAAGIIACSSIDSENLYISLSARELNANIHIIARGEDPQSENRMIKAGADTVVYPLQLGGKQIASLVSNQIKNKHDDDFMNDYDLGVLGYYLKVYHNIDNHKITVKEILDKTDTAKAIAIKFQSGSVLDNPPDNVILSENDSLLLLYKKSPDNLTDLNAEKLKWTDDLVFGIPQIDEQHKGLFSLIQKLNFDREKNESKEQLVKIFNQLLEYTDIHFKTEEELFEKYDYPDKDKHHQAHQDLIEKVLAFKKDKNYIFESNVTEFLNVWIKEHILIEDRKYKDFLLEKLNLS